MTETTEINMDPSSGDLRVAVCVVEQPTEDDASKENSSNDVQMTIYNVIRSSHPEETSQHNADQSVQFIRKEIQEIVKSPSINTEQPTDVETRKEIQGGISTPQNNTEQSSSIQLKKAVQENAEQSPEIEQMEDSPPDDTEQASIQFKKQIQEIVSTHQHNSVQSPGVQFKKDGNEMANSYNEASAQSIEESACGPYKKVAIYEEDSPCQDDENLYRFENIKQEASSCNFDAEMMIELIKQHPIIWDSKAKEYNTTAKRLSAWRYVSQQLGIDENICRSKWKNIRDSYKKCINRREIAVRTGARRKKPPFCRFFKELEFLHDVVSLKDSVDNITSTSQPVNQDDNKTQHTKTYIVCTDSGEEFVNQPIPIDLESHSVLEAEKQNQSNSLPEMEQENHNTTHQEVYKEYTVSERSESELFCASLVGTFERLDQRSKQLAKIKIQQLLFELEFSDPENSYSS